MSFNILIVDDSKILRSVVKKALRIANVPMNEVYEAANGAEALEIAKGNWIDLILADINMPVMNGIELVDRLLGDEMLASIPVVIVSSEGSASRLEQLKDKGICGHLRKPFQPEELRNIVFEELGIPNE